MNLTAVIYDKKDDIINYIYNDNDKYFGHRLSDNGYGEINKNTILEAFKLLLFNDNCKYLKDSDGYKIYYDEENNLKHFLKDGKEDFHLFWEYNTTPLIQSLKKDNKTKYYNRLNEPKKITLKDFVFATTEVALMVLISFTMSLGIRGIDVNSAIKYGVDEMKYSVAQDFNIFLNKVDKEEALNMILSSDNLPNGVNEILANNDLFEDVMPYYKNTKMEYLLNSKLNNITNVTFSKNSYLAADGKLACYNFMNPNIIYTKEGEIITPDVWGHEFIHLLQYPLLDYRYIVESTATIISYEYFSEAAYGYENGVKNIRLLMDTIGPKVIWEYIFTGNKDSLDNILKQNLSEDDYKKIILMFYNNPSNMSVEEDMVIEEIIGRLYYNLHNKNIKDDYSIYSPSGEFINNRIYFNQRKAFTISYECTKEYAIKNGLITPQILYSKKIPNELLYLYENDEEKIIRQRHDFINCTQIGITENGLYNLKTVDGKELSLSEEEAIEKGFMKVENIIFITEEEKDLYLNLEDADIKPIETFKVNSEYVIFSIDAEDPYPVKVITPGLDKRFSGQMISDINTEEKSITK